MFVVFYVYVQCDRWSAGTDVVDINIHLLHSLSDLSWANWAMFTTLFTVFTV